MEDQRDKVGQAVSPASEQSPPGLDRRKFLGALGATAAAALLGPEGLNSRARAPATPSRFEPWTFLWEGPLRFPTAAASWGSTASGPIRARNQPNRTRPGGSSSSSTTIPPRPPPLRTT